MRLAQINGINNPSNIFTSSNNLAGDFTSRLLLYGIAISGFIFLAQIVFAGFNYLTAGGDPGKVQAATTRITTSLIGLVVVISVFFILQIVQAVFGLNII